MKSFIHVICLAVALVPAALWASVSLAAPANPGSAASAPLVAQYSGSYGGSNSGSGSSSRTSYRSYRGLIKLGVFVVFLLVSAVGYLIRKMSGE